MAEFFERHRSKLQAGKDLVRSETAKNSLVLFSGSVVNSILALITVIIISRALSPADFGLIATFNAVCATLIGFTNFGLDTAAIKIISSYLNHDRHKAGIVMKVIFVLEILSGLLIGLVGIFFSRPIANALGGPQLLSIVRLAFFSSVFGSAAAFVSPFFVAHKQFLKNSLVSIVSNFSRALAVIIFLLAASLSFKSIIWSYALAPVLAFFVGLLTVPKEWKEAGTRKEEKEALKEIFHFSKWILLSYIATVIAGKLDIFLLSRIKGSETVGYYAAAQQLTSIMPMLIGAITTAVLPKFSALKKSHELVSFFKKISLGVVALAFLLIPVLFISSPLIHLVFGSKYNASIPAFNVLFVAYLIALISNTLSLALYVTGKPKLLTYVNYIGLGTTIVFYPILIGRYGLIGAAFAFLLNTVIGTVIVVWMSIRAIQNYEEEQVQPSPTSR